MERPNRDRKQLLRALLVGGLFFLPLSASADEVYLKNGDRLTGTLEQFNAETAVMKTTYAGLVTLQRAAISSLATEGPVVAVFQNGDSLTGRVIPRSEGKLELATSQFGVLGPFNIADIRSLEHRAPLAATPLPTVSQTEADEIRLKNGDRLLGTLKEVTAEHVIFTTSYAGDIKLARADVLGMATRERVTVIFQNDDYLTGRLTGLREGALRLETERSGASPDFRLADVKAVYRGDPQEVVRRREEVKLSGILNAGLNVDRGNSNNESYHFDGQLRARTPKNRYTIAAEFNQKRSDSKKTEENILGSLKYDHFLTQKWFLYNSATFKHNEFEDLNLRSSLSGGVGYQFFETDDLFLSLEGGLAYVNEDFKNAADNDYAGGRWSLDYQHRLASWVRFFHFHEGLLGTDIENLIVRTRSGLRFPLAERLRTTAQLNLDWDRSPPPGSTSTDRKYLFTLGYEW